MAYKTCADCGSKLSGGFCPYCDEETLIVDQYREEGMPLPPPDSEFMQRYEQNSKVRRDIDTVTVEYYMKGEPKKYKQCDDMEAARTFMQALSINPDCEAYGLAKQ